MTLARKSGASYQLLGALAGLARFLLAQGDLAGAENYLRKALDVAREKKAEIAELIVSAQAPLLLEQGKPAEAEKLLRTAVAELHKQDHVAEAEAHAQLARCLLAQDRLGEAQAAIGQAQERSRQQEHVAIRLSVAIVAAEVDAASPQGRRQAMRHLEEALSDATASGFVRLQYEARLGLGRLELASGRIAEGRARLAALEQEAGAKGFELIVRKAKAERAATE